MKAHNLDIVGYLKLGFTPTDPDHAVRLRDLTGLGSAKQPVFVVDVTPTSSGNVGSKQYVAGTVPINKVLTSCVSDTTNVRIHFQADGGTTYSPVVTIDGGAVTFIEEVPGDKRLFQGYRDVVVASTRDIEVVSSTGATYSVRVEISAAGPQMTQLTVVSIPAGQTAVKANDLISISGKVTNDAVSITIQDYGAAKGTGTITLGAIDSGGAGYRSFTGYAIASSRTGNLTIQANAVNQLGTKGNTLASSQTVTMDQTYPVITVSALTYNNGRTALGMGDTATLSLSISGQSTQTFDFAYGTYTGTRTAYVTSRTLTVNQAITSSSGGVTITAARASNGATASKTVNVAIMSIAPTGYIEMPGCPSEVVPASGSSGNIPEYPRLGKATFNITTDAHINTYTAQTSSTNNQQIVVNCAGSEYAFFIYPKALGLATFVDLNTSFAGGWDGATWPDDGSIGYTYGPKTITRNGIEYYLYRSDFAGTASTFSVTFANPGLAVGPGPTEARTVYLLRSGTPGAEYEVRFVLNQNQLCVRDTGSNTPYPRTDTPQMGTWKAQSLGEEIAITTARGKLIVSDAQAAGHQGEVFKFTGVVMQNDAGMQATVPDFYYMVAGFEPRTVTFAAFAQLAPIGSVVRKSSKVVAYYLGSPNPLTFRTDKTVAQKSFTICDSSGKVVAENGTHIWLNDQAYAQSNTSGTLSVQIEEIL